MRLVGILAGATVVALASTAAATPDVKQCVEASEKGQRAQKAGKLREARDNYLLCGQDSCPQVIRHDCAQWSAELANALPTVVFGAKDASGRDLFDINITMDGEVLVQKLDGKAVAVDPGPHTFRFESTGFPPVIEKVLVKEGERSRVVNVVFGGGADSNAPPATTKTEPVRETPPNRGDAAGGHTAFPWVLVGLGAAAVASGIVLFVTAPDRPDNCIENSKQCTQRPGQDRASLDADRDQAARADSQPVVGIVVIGAGAALATIGLVWHLLEPTKSSAAVRPSPWMTANGGGLVLGGAF